MTDALVEFLLARIAEDEDGAQAAAKAAGYHWTPDPVPGRDGAPAIDRHYARHDPARVLAECEAKRRIIDQVWAYEHTIDGEWGSGRSVEQMQTEGVEPDALRHMAAVYADHPDYRQEWRP